MRKTLTTVSFFGKGQKWFVPLEKYTHDEKTFHAICVGVIGALLIAAIAFDFGIWVATH